MNINKTIEMFFGINSTSKILIMTDRPSLASNFAKLIKKYRCDIFNLGKKWKLRKISNPIAYPKTIKDKILNHKNFILIHQGNIPDIMWEWIGNIKKKIIENGGKCLILQDWEDWYLKRKFWDMNYIEFSNKIKAILRIIEPVKKIRVVSGCGTDVSFLIKNWDCDGSIEDDILYLPSGEIYTSPVLKSFNGTIVIDGTVSRYWVPKKPQKLVFKKGELVFSSLEFKNRINKYAQPIIIDEFGIGLNPGIRKIYRNISVDEKAKGTVHFAIGTLLNKIKSQQTFHIDFVIRKPQIYFDKKINIPIGNVQFMGR